MPLEESPIVCDDKEKDDTYKQTVVEYVLQWRKANQTEKKSICCIGTQMSMEKRSKSNIRHCEAVANIR